MLKEIRNWLFNVKTRTVVVSALLLFVLAGCSLELDEQPNNATGQQYSEEGTNLVEQTDDSSDKLKPLTSFAEVAQYLREYNTLPPNFITKEEAGKLGWVASEGNLHEVAPGMSIGGNRFGNREGLLPKEKNRKYFEADIDYDGDRRNAKRIVYSNDGLIFMTTDHYESFTNITDEGSVIND